MCILCLIIVTLKSLFIATQSHRLSQQLYLTFVLFHAEFLPPVLILAKLEELWLSVQE